MLLIIKQILLVSSLENYREQYGEKAKGRQRVIHTGRTVLNIRATWKNVVTGPNFTTLKLFNNSNDSNHNNKTNIDDDDNSKNLYRVGSTLIINCTRQFHFFMRKL